MCKKEPDQKANRMTGPENVSLNNGVVLLYTHVDCSNWPNKRYVTN